ncbi:MAG: hypothetical protein NTX91_05465 [candidate division SR1 bacterium]|nr:hypothetical protein [candidate division SR1 bacterium]
MEKLNTPTGKEQGKNKPSSSFENIKKAVDKVKQAEDTEQKKDEKILNVLEQELQASESHVGTGGQAVKQTRIQKKVVIYKQTIRARMARHPERPTEVGEAALSVVETIATSDQDPNIIARSIGKIMKFILQL